MADPLKNGIKNMISITNYPAGKTLESFRSTSKNIAVRAPVARSSRFQNILAAFQTRHYKNPHKTSGLTIADYRARAIFTKSHYRPQPRPARAEVKNSVSHRFAVRSIKPAMSTTRLHSGLKIEDKDSINAIEKPLTKTPPLSAALNNQQIIEQNVQKAAVKYDLPPALIKAVIQAESNFQVDAVSAAGAQGLMQLMPATAEELGVKNPLDIRQNIEGGSRYLRKMLDRFGGSVHKALAAYNAGPGTVLKYNGQVPYPETRKYVKRVLRFSKQMV
jgi:soluble lytic murein transglycosylase-like protein